MESMFERFMHNLLRYGLEYFKLYYSEYDGTCMDNKDPEEQGRIMVRVPQVCGNESIGWAWPKMPWAGKDSGAFIVPDVNDPVIVTFRNGNVRYPRYQGGWWPKVDGTDNFASGFDAYTDGVPTKRAFRTKAGHELSFQDDPENLGCKFVWHDPANDKYTFVAFTKEGNVQIATHVGSFLEMRTTEGDELNMLVDKNGSSIIQDKDGIKLIDASGNVIEMKQDLVQIISKKNVVLNSQSINAKTGGMSIGDVANESAVKGTSWLSWWNSTILPWLMAHTHPTGVGPSGPPSPPLLQAPTAKQLLTDKLKVQ